MARRAMHEKEALLEQGQCVCVCVCVCVQCAGGDALKPSVRIVLYFVLLAKHVLTHALE